MASSQRDADQIQADLAATRDRIAASLESLIDQVHPTRVKQREVAGLKRFARGELERAKSLVFNARGDLRTARLAKAGAVLAGAVAVLSAISAARRR